MREQAERLSLELGEAKLSLRAEQARTTDLDQDRAAARAEADAQRERAVTAELKR